jgi:hypothetical protein
MFRFVLCVAVSVFISCSGTQPGPVDGGQGGGGQGGGTAACMPNNTDGASSCQTLTACKGGEYCSVNICKVGCITSANCPLGQGCDMSAAANDVFINKSVGICRACPSPVVDSGVAACGEFRGAYNVSQDSSSSAACPSVSGECSVTQTGCMVTLTCPGAGISKTVTLDMANKGNYQGTITSAGQSINTDCRVSFTSTSLSVDCQFTVPGGGAAGLVCKTNGAKK